MAGITGKKNTKRSSHKIGVIGTGMLGGAVAARLASKGCDVSVYNRTRRKTRIARDAGAMVLDSPAKVAEASDVIIITIKDADAVRSVSFGAKGIVAGAHRGITVADMSTISPLDSESITAEYKKYGITKIDAPVMGGPDAAKAGSLIGMISGSKAGFEAARCMLGHITQDLFFLGTKPGTAHTVKMAMNMQITMLALALSEGITLVSRSGVSPKKFLDVLNATYFSTGMSRKKAYRMMTGRNQSPTFTLANLRKDIGIMAEAAESLNLDLPMTSTAGSVYQEAVDNGYGNLDYTGIIRHIERINKK